MHKIREYFAQFEQKGPIYKGILLLCITILVLVNIYTLHTLLNILEEKPRAVVKQPYYGYGVPEEETVKMNTIYDWNIMQYIVSPDELVQKDTTEGTITVDWNEYPREGNFIFNRTAEDRYNELSLGAKYLETKDFFEYRNKITINNVGTVKEGPYTGSAVYTVGYYPFMDVGSMGGPYEMRSLIVESGSELILLSKHSQTVGVQNIADVYILGLKVNDSITIENLEPPQKIDIKDSPYFFYRVDDATSIVGIFFSNPTDLTKLYQYNENSFVYADSNGCYYVYAKDGTFRQYILHNNLSELEKYEDKSKLKEEFVYRSNGHLWMLEGIVWNDKTINQEKYTLQSGRCGFGVCYSVDDLTADRVMVTGKTGQGQNIYELKNEVPENKEILQKKYDEVYVENGKASFDEFLTQHPIIYWKDPFERYIRFENQKYMPMAECGKPVIYLYPEQTMDVSVKVSPNGGFTVTEPVYGENGWFVRATPESELYNYADEKIYPYLFWEGHGMNYQRPEEGFVVPRADVQAFLETSLAKQGLIAKEYNEFIEFWLPRMQEKDYYFITFLPQDQFDRLAPLEVSPRPDTVIRVFMDYEGLENPIEVQPQELFTPERNGFTVVEWGGALHK